MLQLAAGENSYFSALHKTWQATGRKLKATPAKSSLSEYRNKVSFNFFKEIFDRANGQLNPDRKKFRGFYIYAIDGDHLTLPASEDIFANGFKGFPYSKNNETYFPKMYTVQAYDVINGVIRDFKYSNQIGEGLLAREIVPILEANSIALYDRLYSNYKTAFSHQKAQNYFIARVKTQNQLQQSVIKEFCKSKHRDQWVFLPAGQEDQRKLSPIKVRLVKFKNPKSRQEIVYMTNLPNNIFTRLEIVSLYQRRWEIESSFRDLTSSLKMCDWHTTKLNGILQEIYALLWLANTVKFFLTTKFYYRYGSTTASNKYYKSNFKFSAQLLLENLDLLIKKKITKFLKILEHCSRKTLEKREHLSRNYPRAIRIRDKQYLNLSMVERRA